MITPNILILLSATLAIVIFVVAAFLAERFYRSINSMSADFGTVNASTNLFEKFKHYLKSGAEVIIPVGMGLYPINHKKKNRELWINRIESWSRMGVKINIIISCPNKDGIDFWQPLAEKKYSQLKVYTLYKENADPLRKKLIEQIDIFHTVLAIDIDQSPLAMWVERDHPHDSTTAYNVSFRSKDDIIGNDLIDFNRYLEVLRFLIMPGPHVVELSAELTPKAAA